jgi:3-methylfumaryl-CoA hydratase
VVTPSPALLFRYSALTFNGHRIHYDADYCRKVEGYPGLVVHGPLLATCLLGLLREAHPAASVARFAFRARKPLFAPEPFLVCGSDEGPHGAQLWIEDAAGKVAMSAEATFG